MQKLTKQTKQNLTDLFNAIQASRLMEDAAVEKGDYDSVYMWREDRYNAIVELYDSYGIELACYTVANEYLSAK